MEYLIFKCYRIMSDESVYIREKTFGLIILIGLIESIGLIGFIGFIGLIGLIGFIELIELNRLLSDFPPP